MSEKFYDLGGEKVFAFGIVSAPRPEFLARRKRPLSQEEEAEIRERMKPPVFGYPEFQMEEDIRRLLITLDHVRSGKEKAEAQEKRARLVREIEGMEDEETRRRSDADAPGLRRAREAFEDEQVFQ